MAIKLIDTMKPMGDFPVAEAEDISLSDGTSVEDAVTYVPKKFITTNELSTRDPSVVIEIVTGEDNTLKIVNALKPREEFIDWYQNTDSRNRFGIPSFYGNRIDELRIYKIAESNAVITAVMNTGKVLTRYVADGTLTTWKDSSTGRDIYTDEIILEDNANLLGFDLTFEGAPTHSTYIEVSGDLGNSHEDFSATVYIPAQDPNSMNKIYLRNPMAGKVRLFQSVSYLYQTVRHTASNPTPSGRSEYYATQMRFLLKAKSPNNIKTIYVRYNSQVVKVSLSQKYLTSDTVTKLTYVMPYVHDTSQDLGRFVGNDLSNGYDTEGMMHGESVSRAKLTIANITDSKPGTLALVVGGYPPSKYAVVSVEGAVGTRTVPFEDPDTGDYVRISPDWERDAWSVDVRISKASIPSAYLSDSQLAFYIRMKYVQMRN